MAVKMVKVYLVWFCVLRGTHTHECAKKTKVNTAVKINVTL